MAALLATLIWSAADGRAADPGWTTLDIAATGTYARRYIPYSLDLERPAPVVIFLHGSGSSPEAYEPYLEDGAEAAGCVLVLPKSTHPFAWGAGPDDETIAEGLRLLADEVDVDQARVGAAGHSSGGAFAYLLTYLTVSGFNAVFTLAAPYYEVNEVADPAYTAPIRMYYGTEDPNYTGGGWATLRQQWIRLGVEFEEDIQPGYGHNSWPDASMEAGLAFLVSHTYPVEEPCTPGATTLCLNDGRFEVEVEWHAFDDTTGPGRVAPATSEDSGLLWFFDEDNWEMLVKVLDGCGVNGHYWVFAAATTNVEYTLTVTDTETGTTKEYTNEFGVSSPAITDAEAFATCP